MELKSNQLVVFENGHKAGYLEAVWSESKQAFWIRTDEIDEETGLYVRLYSNTIIDKTKRKTSKFTPNCKNCTVQIKPLGETEKAYQVEDGSNGLIGKRCKVFYKYIAKSVCYVDANGKIFAPAWAMR